MYSEEKNAPFIDFLEKLNREENRAALAAFRKGLGKDPGTSMDMYRFLGPFVYDDIPPWEERAIFLSASLFALNPEPNGIGNMGAVFKWISNETNSESIEKRFVALLESHPEDLETHLRHAVSLSKSKGIPINWNTLFKDITHWNNPQRFVQKQWARSFWGNVREESKE